MYLGKTIRFLSNPYMVTCVCILCTGVELRKSQTDTETGKSDDSASYSLIACVK